jgi:predicted GNAT family acetyltransferase
MTTSDPTPPPPLGKIQFEESGTRRRYYLAHPSGESAELVFTRPSAEFIIIEHTAVPDVFRGQGVGTKLVERAVEDARIGGWKILPLCPFAAAQFRRHREWADVLRSGVKPRGEEGAP